MITIRPVQVTDAEVLVELINTNLEHLKNFACFQEPTTVRKQRKLLEGPDGTGKHWWYAILVDDRIIGTVGLNELDVTNRNARIGMIIFSPADRHYHYGSEALECILRVAFMQAQLHLVYVNVFGENDPAKEYYLRAGFTFEGMLRDRYRIGDVFHDLAMFSQTKREWVLNKKACTSTT